MASFSNRAAPESLLRVGSVCSDQLIPLHALQLSPEPTAARLCGHLRDLVFTLVTFVTGDHVPSSSLLSGNPYLLSDRRV